MAIILGKSFREDSMTLWGKELAGKNSFNLKRLKSRKLVDTEFSANSSNNTAAFSTLVNIFRVAQSFENDDSISELALGMIFRLDPLSETKSPNAFWLVNFLYHFIKENPSSNWSTEAKNWLANFQAAEDFDDKIEERKILSHKWRDIVDRIPFSRRMPLQFVHSFVSFCVDEGFSSIEDVQNLSQESWLEAIPEHPERERFIEESKMFIAGEVRSSFKKERLLLKQSINLSSSNFPNAFEIAEAWNPLKFNQYLNRINSITVKQWSRFHDFLSLSEDLASKRFNINASIKSLVSDGDTMKEVVELRRQAAIVLPFKKSLSSYASHLRAYGKFCDAIAKDHFPVNIDCIRAFAGQHCNPRTLDAFLASIGAAELFIDIPFEKTRKESWGKGQIEQIAKGLKKYNIKKKRTAFSQEQIIRIGELAKTFFDDANTASKFEILMKLSFVFFLRLNNEAEDLVVGNNDDSTRSLIGDRTHVICLSKEGDREVVVIKLRSRKNRQAHAVNGHNLIRFCCCEKNLEKNPHAHGFGMCPVHYLYPKLLFGCGDILTEGDRVFFKKSSSKSTNFVRNALKEIVKLDEPTLGDHREAGCHGPRLGGGNEAKRNGASNPTVQSLGGWLSKDGSKPYKPLHFEEVDKADEWSASSSDDLNK